MEECKYKKIMTRYLSLDSNDMKWSPFPKNVKNLRKRCRICCKSNQTSCYWIYFIGQSRQRWIDKAHNAEDGIVCCSCMLHVKSTCCTYQWICSGCRTQWGYSSQDQPWNKVRPTLMATHPSQWFTIQPCQDRLSDDESLNDTKRRREGTWAAA